MHAVWDEQNARWVSMFDVAACKTESIPAIQVYGFCSCKFVAKRIRNRAMKELAEL